MIKLLIPLRPLREELIRTANPRAARPPSQSPLHGHTAAPPTSGRAQVAGVPFDLDENKEITFTYDVSGPCKLWGLGRVIWAETWSERSKRQGIMDPE